MLFDKICRKNGITHRLTQPASPNQNGKVERFHGTFRPDFLDQAEAFTQRGAGAGGVDACVADYNTDRPIRRWTTRCRSLRRAVRPVENQQRTLIDLWLPPAVAACPAPGICGLRQSTGAAVTGATSRQRLDRGPIAFDRVVPPSGNLMVAGKQFWLGPARAGSRSVSGQTRRDPPERRGGRIKSLRST
ncbi:hypothetical protein Asera_37170 [Actinocatenispora sera]|uniref:Integrase catalytic domain-containing protein n=1 Tax=Actinocatenispora sera TaxID=390989 RepID=A0A810L3R0_9ACTN|nr:hypothetical protein Asera_37170 [Actinocatenispora sera]